MPNPKLYMPSAPGRLEAFLSAEIPILRAGGLVNLPKQCEGEEPGEESAVDGVDAEEHLGACRTGQGLTYGEDLLVLCVLLAWRTGVRGGCSHHWFVDPS